MKKKILYTVLPIIPMILWGSLFPFVKIGYSAFNIDSKNIGDIIHSTREKRYNQKERDS